MLTLKSILKYVIEGIAVAVAAYVIPQQRFPTTQEQLVTIILIGLTASLVFAILDLFSPSIGVTSRRGAGFGIGLHTVGFGVEGFDDNGVPSMVPPPPPPPSPVADPESLGACSTSTASCTYAPNATAKQRAKYVCQVKNGACTPTHACLNNGGICELKDEVRGLVDVVGKTCTLEQVPAQAVCRLSQATASENFDSKIVPSPVDFSRQQGEPEGFEGFSKVY